MTMTVTSPFAMIHTTDQWRRVAHDNTALDVEKGIVQLAWEFEARDEDEPAGFVKPAGLAFDPWCRLYHSVPEAGQLEKWLWASDDKTEEPVSLFEDVPPAIGEFTAVDAGTGPLHTPRGLAIDRDGRLFIAETGKGRILIFDLVEKRLLRKVTLTTVPNRLATDGRKVYGVINTTTPGLMSLDARNGPRVEVLPETVTAPTAVAVNIHQHIYILDQGASENARIVPLADPEAYFDVPFATDILFVEADILVAARGPGDAFLRFRLQADGQSELPHLRALHYDGRGIALTPDGHVGYWSDRGFLRATLARVRYETEGRITSFRLDAKAFQTQWGRLFIDACIPRGTAIKVHCLVQDEPPDTERLDRTPPANTLSMTVHRPDLSPPMPPKLLVKNTRAQQLLHRRSQGRELPWLCGEDDFATYEAPVIAPPGRYLWLVLELMGTTRKTPQLRSVRAEYPSHDLLRRLPRIYSRKEPVADFLRRYLAILEGDLRDLDWRSSCREVLLDPYAVPEPVLPWLGSFIGMDIDKRWSERAKRRLIAEGIWLFRYRGTVQGLKRFLEIYLDRGVVIIEHFKVRGLGGALLGEADALTSNSVLGAGFRIGGQLDQNDGESGVNIADAITTHAHRFSVVLPISLDAEQQQVVEHILETHRPAHTLFDLCTVDAGMRVGLGLHLGLTSLVGRTSGFGQLQIGGSILGRGDVIGKPKPGTFVGSSSLGRDSRVG